MKERQLPQVAALSLRVASLLTAVLGVLACLCVPRGIAAEPTSAPRANALRTACDIPGEPIQWIADYCMALIGTDDEIAASECINDQLTQVPSDACAAKAQFKRGLCGLVVANGFRSGTVDACVEDPGFSGNTVARGGVGEEDKSVGTVDPR